MSSAAGRRKRAAPKVQHAPAPVVVVPEDPLIRAARAAGVLLISEALTNSLLTACEADLAVLFQRVRSIKQAAQLSEKAVHSIAARSVSY